MNEKYKMLSEEDYVTKIQLKNIYQNTAAEMIYEEILAYRSLYKYPLHFCERHYYVTMNPTLIKKMVQIYEGDPLISKQENLFLKEGMTLSLWIDQYTQMNNIEIKDELIEFLVKEEPYILKIFVLHFIDAQEDFLFHFLQFYQKEHWYSVLNSMQKIVIENKETLDLTYEFRHFLNIMYLHLTTKMLPLTGRSFSEEFSRDELLELFPQLNEKAISFYTSHSLSQHYYTILDYQEYCHVSYESARQAMQRFLYLKFYQRIKVGKKYVYTPTF